MHALHPQTLWGLLFTLGLLLTEQSSAQSSIADRALMDQTLMEATRLGSLKTGVAEEKPETLLDREFGVLKVRPLSSAPPQVLFSVDAQVAYTSNAALTPNQEISDWLLRTTARAAWFPKITDRLALLVAGSYSLLRFADQSALDLDDLNLQAGFLWTAGKGPLPGDLMPLAAWAHYRYNRILSPWEWQPALYQTHFLEVGARPAWALSRTVTVWLGLNAAFSVEGGPDFFRRHEYSAQTGVLWQMTPRLAVTGLYRFAYYDHVKTPRHDLNHLLAAALTYRFTPAVQVGLYLNAVSNQSSDRRFDYQVLQTGLNLALTKTW